MSDLQGKDYRARVDLTNKDGEIVAAVGETCERVTPSSLGWLLEQHLIEPVSVITETVWADLGRPGEPIVPTVAPLEDADALIETRAEGDA